jgi:hypothetical protein
MVSLVGTDGVLLLGDNIDQDIVLMKLDEEGSSLWKKVIPSSTRMVASNVIQTNEGGYALVGTREINGHSTVMIIKTNSDGGL